MKEDITNKTKSKLAIRLATEGALFSVFGLCILDLLTFFCVKTFRDNDSGFVEILSYKLWENLY